MARESIVICESAYLTLIGIERTGKLTNAPRAWSKMKRLVIEAKAKGEKVSVLAFKIKNVKTKPHKCRKTLHATKFIMELANKDKTDPTYNVGVKEV